MKCYSIFAREQGAEREVELLQVDANPQAIADGVRKKRLLSMPKYSQVRIVDNHEQVA